MTDEEVIKDAWRRNAPVPITRDRPVWRTWPHLAQPPVLPRGEEPVDEVEHVIEFQWQTVREHGFTFERIVGRYKETSLTVYEGRRKSGAYA